MGDVFMNILTTNGFVGRYVTDWAGPDAQVKNVAIKLGTPNTRRHDEAARARSSVEGRRDGRPSQVAGKNAWGDHVTATVKVERPR